MNTTEKVLRELLGSLETWTELHKSEEGYPMVRVREVFGSLIAARDRARAVVNALNKLEKNDT